MSAAFVAVIVQLPELACAVSVEAVIVQLALFEEYVTAPVPVPPVVRSVLEPRYATVDGVANALRVAWVSFEIVMLKDRVGAVPTRLEARMEPVKVPLAVGAPDNTPVEPVSVRPEGSVPEASVKGALRPALPTSVGAPLAVKVCE